MAMKSSFWCQNSKKLVAEQECGFRVKPAKLIPRMTSVLPQKKQQAMDDRRFGKRFRRGECWTFGCKTGLKTLRTVVGVRKIGKKYSGHVWQLLSLENSKLLWQFTIFADSFSQPRYFFSSVISCWYLTAYHKKRLADGSIPVEGSSSSSSSGSPSIAMAKLTCKHKTNPFSANLSFQKSIQSQTWYIDHSLNLHYKKGMTRGREKICLEQEVECLNCAPLDKSKLNSLEKAKATNDNLSFCSTRKIFGPLPGMFCNPQSWHIANKKTETNRHDVSTSKDYLNTESSFWNRKSGVAQ